jgi:hypothetical protein
MNKNQGKEQPTLQYLIAEELRRIKVIYCPQDDIKEISLKLEGQVNRVETRPEIMTRFT